MIMSDAKRRYQCQLCNYSAKWKRNLQSHIKLIHIKIKDFQCTQCDYATYSNSSLDKHVKVVHGKMKDFQCNLCEYSTYLKSRLQKHVKAVHGFSCTQCNYASPWKRNLKLHVKSEHADKTKDFRCNLCEYSTYSNSMLRRHVKAVHEKTKDFKCTQCSYATVRKGSLRQHVKLVHDKMKHVKCSQCEYSTYSNCELQRHVKVVHHKIKAFKCQVCEYAAGTKFQLQLHMKSVHDLITDFKDLQAGSEGCTLATDSIYTSLRHTPPHESELPDIHKEHQDDQPTSSHTSTTLRGEILEERQNCLIPKSDSGRECNLLLLVSDADEEVLKEDNYRGRKISSTFGTLGEEIGENESNIVSAQERTEEDNMDENDADSEGEGLPDIHSAVEHSDMETEEGHHDLNEARLSVCQVTADEDPLTTDVVNEEQLALQPSTSGVQQEEKGGKEKRSVIIDDVKSDSESDRSSWFSRSRSPSPTSESDCSLSDTDEDLLTADASDKYQREVQKEGEKEKINFISDDDETDSETDTTRSRSSRTTVPEEAHEELPDLEDEITTADVISTDQVEKMESGSSHMHQEEKGAKEKKTEIPLQDQNIYLLKFQKIPEEKVQAVMEAVQGAISHCSASSSSSFTQEMSVIRMTRKILEKVSYNNVVGLLASLLTAEEVKAINRETGVKLKPKNESLDVKSEIKPEPMNFKSEIKEPTVPNVKSELTDESVEMNSDLSHDEMLPPNNRVYPTISEYEIQCLLESENIHNSGNDSDD